VGLRFRELSAWVAALEPPGERHFVPESHPFHELADDQRLQKRFGRTIEEKKLMEGDTNENIK